jgi:hypothetical protein
MSKLDQALDADDLMILAERIEQLAADDAEWVARLFQELLRARAHEGELLAGQASGGQQQEGGERASLMSSWRRSRWTPPSG